MTPLHCCSNRRGNTIDPQTAWTELLDTYADCDWGRAEELATCLLEWLDHDGFPPHTVLRLNVGPHLNRHVARSVCLFVLDRLKEVRPAP